MKKGLDLMLDGSYSADLAEYFGFGYLPSQFRQRHCYTILRNIVDGLPDNLNRSEEQYVSEGARRWHQAVGECLDAHPNARRHVVPLSGGLDSRAILAALLAHGIKQDVLAVTYGTPGTYDFEFSRLVARKAGVEHITLDLTKAPVSADLLIQTAAKGATCTRVLEQYYANLFRSPSDNGAVYWMGFLGDPLAGSHLDIVPSPDWASATSRFVVRNQIAKPPDCLVELFDLKAFLPDSPLVDPKILDMDEQLDLLVRQTSFIAPIVCPDDSTNVLPFLQPVWAQFMLSVPRPLRVNSRLYENILSHYSKALFRLPTKNHDGLGLCLTSRSKLAYRARRRSARYLRAALRHLGYRRFPTSPRCNFVDVDEQLRLKTQLADTIWFLLKEYRDLNLPACDKVHNLWERHQQRTANHGDLLIHLASLVVNIRSHRLGGDRMHGSSRYMT
jgi:hypothetical protein